MTAMEVFSELTWDGSSGPGSDPTDASPYLIFLELYIDKYDIRSVLDLGCGDGRLARATNWGCAKYIGLDIKSGYDILKCDLPSADLVIIKDVLQHWDNNSIELMRTRLQAYEHSLITNCCDPFRTNEDIRIGDCRALNLAADPFNWPVKEIFRWRGHETKSVVQFSGRKLTR